MQWQLVIFSEQSVSEGSMTLAACQVKPQLRSVTNPSTTYGVSYPHCSLKRLLHVACGCCPHLPFGLGPGRRRSWPRSSGVLKPVHWDTPGTQSFCQKPSTAKLDTWQAAEGDHSVSYSLVSRVTMMRIGRLFIPPTQLELHMKL